MAKKSKAAARKGATKTAKSAKAAKKSRKGGAKAGKRSSARGGGTKGASKSTARKSAKKAAKKTPARTAKKAASKAGRSAAKTSARKTAKTTARKSGRPSAARKASTASRAGSPARARTAAPSSKRANLDRERRTIQEDVHGVPSSLDLDRTASSARSGRFEFEEKLREHTSTGPAMTGGDIDADWEDAESVGEEAPGGDNPTPDQDVVDEIGRAVGIEYDDDEELQGGDEVSERDRHRWELDPRSKDDFDDEGNG